MDLKQKSERMIKVIYIGSAKAGKTSLFHRVATDQFIPDYTCIIAGRFLEKKYEVDGVIVKVHFWDTAGPERFISMPPAYYRGMTITHSGADAVVVCYDLNDQQSFKKINHWLQEAHIRKVNEQSITLVGCKKDLKIEVSSDLVNEFLRDKPYLHFETSAKTGQGVAEAMEAIVRSCVERKRSLEVEMKKELDQGREKDAMLPKGRGCAR